jgi:hypothetical protein
MDAHKKTFILKGKDIIGKEVIPATKLQIVKMGNQSLCIKARAELRTLFIKSL